MRIRKILAVTTALLLLVTPCTVTFAQTVPAAAPAAQTTSSSAQATTPRLRGAVLDPSGALMPSVDIAIIQGSNVVKAGKTDATGNFSFDLAAGEYQMAVTAPDFKVYTQTVRVTANMRPLAITLSLAGITAVVDVRDRDNEREVTVDAASSLDATTLTAEQIKDLPENEEDLLAYLQMLAGGEGNAQLIIDGFEGGRLPTRDQIAQIVIEPNSFNANGTGPRITIVSRQPGLQRWGGSLSFSYRDSALNARTPGSSNKTPMQQSQFSTNYSGPVIKGKWSMTINLGKSQSESGANALRAVTPTGPVNSSFLSPQRSENLNISNQIYLSTTHQLMVSVGYNRNRNENSGIGGITLPERASNGKNSNWNFNVSDNFTISPRMTNNFTFQLNGNTSRNRPVTNAVAVNVLDAFNGGGAQNFSDSRGANFRLSNIVRWTPTQKWNIQLAFNANSQYTFNHSESNYLGTFTFSSLEDYLAGRPLTFTQTSGNPEAETRHTDANVSLQGTYRISPTSSGSVGVQYTLQNHFKDYNNFSPTASYQRQFPKSKTTVSIGARMTHPSIGFPVFAYEQLLRGDGTTRQFNTVISNPNYPDPFVDGDTGTTTGVGNSLTVRGPNFESPYALNSQVSVNQTLPKNWRVTTSFNVTRNVHQMRTRNINAPFPGTPLDPRLTRDEIDRLRPFFPLVGRVNQYESVGNSINEQLNFTVQIPGSPKKFLGTTFGLASVRYGLTWAADDSGATNLYNVRSDWARNDQRHNFQASVSVRPPKIGSLSLNMNATSGRSYSITSGRDENFDQAFNDRPAGVKRNSLRGPAGYTVNLTYSSPVINLRKKPAPPAAQGAAPPTGAAGTPVVISAADSLIQSALAAGISLSNIQSIIDSLSSQPGFINSGAAGAAGQPSILRPQLSFSVNVQNVLNHTRVNAYSGVITSPLFGQPTSWSPGRQIYFSMNTRF